MIKSELVQTIANRNPHLFLRDVENIVNAIFEEITDALASAEASRTALQAEIETLSKDRAGLNTKLIATAGEVQASEARISELEDRLEELGIREQDLI